MPAGVSAYVPLANITLGSSAATVTFSSISQSYRDLVFILQTGNSATTGIIGIFNSDTAANYSYVWGGGSGSAASSGSSASASGAYFGANIWSTNTLTMQFNISIMDYSATDKHKTFLSRADEINTNTTMNAGRWANTAAITSVQFKGVGGSNIIAGTTISLYGVSA